MQPTAKQLLPSSECGWQGIQGIICCKCWQMPSNDQRAPQPRWVHPREGPQEEEVGAPPRLIAELGAQELRCWHGRGCTMPLPKHTSTRLYNNVQVDPAVNKKTSGRSQYTHELVTITTMQFSVDRCAFSHSNTRHPRAHRPLHYPQGWRTILITNSGGTKLIVGCCTAAHKCTEENLACAHRARPSYAFHVPALAARCEAAGGGVRAGVLLTGSGRTRPPSHSSCRTGCCWRLWPAAAACPA